MAVRSMRFGFLSACRWEGCGISYTDWVQLLGFVGVIDEGILQSANLCGLRMGL